MDKRTSQPQHNRRSNCIACGLRGVMVCSDVSVEELVGFQTWIDDLTIRRGETIFQANTPASAVYCIRSGFVKLVDYSSAGGQRIVRIVKCGGVAGMEAVFSPSFEHTAVALEDVVACRIAAADFRRMVGANPLLQRRLHEYSHDALREAEAWLSELAGGNAQVHERIARLLLRLRDGQTNRIHRFSLEDVGAMLGITVETACRNLTELTRAGLLTKGGAGEATRYYKADIAGLEKIANGGEAEKAAPGRMARLD